MNKEEKILNDLALRKFQLASEFLALNGQMGTLLDNYRFNLSKTKSVVGLSAVSAGSIDNRDMESTVRIEISPDGIFSLVPSDASHPNKGNKAYQFRPFGVLEPLYAKAARSDVQKALPLICEIASAKHKLQEVEEEYRIMKKSLALT